MAFDWRRLSLFPSVLIISLLVIVLSACGGGSRSISNPALPGTDQQATENEELPEINLSPPGAAESPGDVGGVIKDAMGVGIPEVEVALNDEDISAMTDESGVFLITGVSAGEHTLTFGKEEHEFYTSTITVDGETPVNIALASSDARIASQTGDFGHSAMHGLVFKAGSDMPVAGAWVLVFDMEGFFRITSSGADGQYGFDILPPGDKFVLGYKRGFKVFFGDVYLPPGESVEYNIPLESIDVGNVAGVVRNPRGEGIGGAAVFLLINRDDGHGPKFQTFTNEHGEYGFEAVPTGAADMLVAHPGYHPGTAAIEIHPGETTHQDFVLEPWGEDLRVVLEGMVINPEEHPIPGAHIKLTDGEGHNFDTESGEGGMFRIELPHPGVYVLRAFKEGYQVVEREIELHPGGNEVLIVMHPLEPEGFGAVVGSVFFEDEEGNERPAFEAHLTLSRGVEEFRESWETWTNEHGMYVFEHVRAGYYVLECEYGEFEPQMVEIEVREGEETVKNFFFARRHEVYGVLHGKVWRVDADGNEHPVFEALVELILPGSEEYWSTYSGEGGYFRFEGLPATEHEYVLEASHPEFGSARIDGISIPPGEETWLDVLLEGEGPGGHGAIGAHVKDQHGNAIPEALVRIWGEGEELIEEGYTNGDGVIWFDGLPAPAPYWLKAWKWDRGSNLAEVYLEPGDEVVVQLVIEKPVGEHGIIFGSVHNYEEQPIIEALMELFKPTEEGWQKIRNTWTNGDGKYEFDPVPGGEYLVKASHPNYYPGAKEVFLEPGNELMVNFVLEWKGGGGYGMLFGYVTDAYMDFGWLPGVLVVVFKGEEPIADAVTNEGGYYEIPELAEGYYAVRFSKEGYETRWYYEVFIGGGAETRLDAELFPTGGGEPARLYGHVWNAEEQPINDAHVKLGFYEGGEFITKYQTWSNDAGYYVIEGIDPGEYTLIVFKEGYALYDEFIGFEAGDNILRNIILHPPG